MEQHLSHLFLQPLHRGRDEGEGSAGIGSEELL